MFEAGRPLLHADADCFFASVALRRRPDLRARPVAVVNHVFVASANYPARAGGVRSAMLVQEARHRCPELVVLDVPYAEVEEVGDALFEIFHRFAPAVEPGSVEEAFLDVGAEDWPAALDTAQALRKQVQQELGITVSVGVGRTKLMAKLASRAAKPDGLYSIALQDEPQLRADLPIGQVWGVGQKTFARLENLDVQRLADLDRIPRAQLQQVCGTTMARRLWQIRAGTDDARVRPVRHRDSLSAESSIAGYGRPDHSPEQLLTLCLDRVLHRAEKAGLVAEGLALTLQPAGEELPLRRKQSGFTATADRSALRSAADRLLHAGPVPPLAGLRVTLTGLLPADQVPQTLF
ncbi:hypothetical protein Kisp01_23770 [Kineosporia sp. NBRC 101677]|uniref:Y-family DNA polymerase n=1 Tax=Kineosporia sp. NBRC 101677 TaxID=3032197 RepID=UPI0024A2F2CB|nr:DNA polymerase IV [Kineosporia sp. NBRC 101677]GLY15362.1 hypothetical protein Kisp01_23770 [Kineosporia sp. NBRC 101677]